MITCLRHLILVEHSLLIEEGNVCLVCFLIEKKKSGYALANFIKVGIKYSYLQCYGLLLGIIRNVLVPLNLLSRKYFHLISVP